MKGFIELSDGTSGKRRLSRVAGIVDVMESEGETMIYRDNGACFPVAETVAEVHALMVADELQVSYSMGSDIVALAEAVLDPTRTDKELLERARIWAMPSRTDAQS